MRPLTGVVVTGIFRMIKLGHKTDRGFSIEGFTLVEMMVVITLIGVIAAVTMPQLIPIMAFGRLEGSVRHLSGFGLSAMARSCLMREVITVKFDLKKQEYWAVRINTVSSSIFDEDEDDGGMDDDEFLNLLGSAEEPDEQDVAAGAGLVRDRFEQFVRIQMMARAQQVDHSGILDEIGPLFEGEEFTLDDTEEEEEEIFDPLLERTQLPEGVEIELVRIGSSNNSSGLVEVELSPLGLYEPVVFHVKNEDGDYLTVSWDPITGSTHIEEGKQSPWEAAEEESLL